MYSDAIKNYLDKHGIKIKFLSEKTGISRCALYGIFHKKRKITIGEYVKICDALRLDMNYFKELIDGENSEFTKKEEERK